MANMRSVVFLSLLLGCSLYSYWLSNKDYEWVIPQASHRSPAAVRDSDSVKQILEKPLRVYKQDMVLGSIDILDKNGKKYFNMGQFAVQGQTQANIVCLEYPFLRLKFLGEGQTVNGRKPSAVVDTLCAVHEKNHEEIKEVPLPFGDLQKIPAQDQKLDYSQADLPVNVQFGDMYGHWPEFWQLESIEFLKDSSQESEKIRFTNSEFLQKRRAPILIK